jgi:TonB-linked SusC/RagA family outer membrane protein
MFLLVIAALCVNAQGNRQVTGVVLNAKEYPMQGVLVSIQESTVTAFTNEGGLFSIEVAVNDIVSFTYEGFESTSIQVMSDTDYLQIVLTETEFGERKSDFIPVAFSRQNRNLITSSVSNVGYDRLSKRQDMNLMNGLGGLLNGLIVQAAPWADTGSDPSFIVRGLKSTSPNAAPMVLVDNVERGFAQLNPREIESITVLKDAAALAIYGSKGANGVVLVTTNRGQSNKRDVNVNAQVGVTNFQRMPEYLNAYDYARLYNKAYLMDGNAAPYYSEEQLQGYKNVVEGNPGADPYRYPNNSFIDNYLKDVVKQQQYDLTMSGGNDIAQYFVLLGYMDQEGIYKYGDNTFNRYNFRSNLDVQVFPKLCVSVDMAGRLENLATPGGNYSYAIFSQFAQTPSNAYPIFNEDGSLGGTTAYPNNPYGLMNNSGMRDQLGRFFDGTLTFNLDLSDLLQGLSWMGRGSFDFRNQYTQQLTAERFAVYQFNEDGTYTRIGNDDNMTHNSWYNMKDRQFTMHSSLNYDRVFDYHRVNSMILFYLQERNSMGISVPFKSVGSAAQLRYAYLNRYLLEGTVAYTGSENFSRGNRFGWFPALSVGWIVSNEAFLIDNERFSFLKIRGSYGVTGLDRPISDRFLYREYWGNSNGYAFGTAGVYRGGTDQLRIGNDNLKWETSYKTNFGVDFGFFNDRLLLTIDGFHDLRKDILVQKYATTPGMAGLPLPYENAGSAESYGVDTEFKLTIPVSDKLRVNIAGNFMRTRNKILDINESFKVDAYQYQKGNPIGQPFGYVSEGLFTEAEIEDYPIIQNGGNIRPGDIKYKDLNNDNIIDGRDTRAIAGSSVPNIIYGFDFGFNFSQFDFVAQFMGMADRYVYMPVNYRQNFYGGGNATIYAFDAWTPETSETATLPRLSVADNFSNSQFSDFWFREASFIRLKSLELGYTLPHAFVNRLGIARSRVYLNGFNLLTFDKIKDYDPENVDAAIYSYPVKGIITLGMYVNF